MMIALLLNSKIQVILPKSYIDMLVREGRYTSRQLYNDSCDFEYDLLVGGSIRYITFDEWYIIENDGTKRQTFIDLYSKRYERCKITYNGRR